MNPLKKLAAFLDKNLKFDGEKTRKEIAGYIVGELCIDPDGTYEKLIEENSIVCEIESLASDIARLNGTEDDMRVMWNRLVYLSNILKLGGKPASLDSIKAYVVQKIKKIATRDSRLGEVSSLLQKVWSDAMRGDALTDDEFEKLTMFDSVFGVRHVFGPVEIRALYEAAKSIIHFAVMYGTDSTLEKVTRYLHVIMSQDMRTSQIGWDLEEHIDWYFDQSISESDRKKNAQELIDSWGTIVESPPDRPSMLRDYQYNENWRLLDQAIEAFIDLPDRLSLVGFTVLSPDSFLWKIFDGENVYYLYAEDFVSSLDQVTANIRNFWPDEINLEFMPVKEPKAF